MREDKEENEDETITIKWQNMYNYDEMEYDDRIHGILFENQFYACKLMLCIDGARGLNTRGIRGAPCCYIIIRVRRLQIFLHNSSNS